MNLALNHKGVRQGRLRWDTQLLVPLAWVRILRLHRFCDVASLSATPFLAISDVAKQPCHLKIFLGGCPIRFQEF